MIETRTGTGMNQDLTIPKKNLVKILEYDVIIFIGNIFTRSLRVHLHSDLAYVERTKLEKKRERNRLAASKCRQRKMEKIQTLGEV